MAKTFSMNLPEFLESDFAIDILGVVLTSLYQNIPEVKNLVSNNLALQAGFGFSDIEEYLPELYAKIRLDFELLDDKSVSIKPVVT